jgi:hypothetical protein
MMCFEEERRLLPREKGCLYRAERQRQDCEWTLGPV